MVYLTVVLSLEAVTSLGSLPHSSLELVRPAVHAGRVAYVAHVGRSAVQCWALWATCATLLLHVERCCGGRFPAASPHHAAPRHAAPFHAAQMWGTAGNVGSILYYLSPMATVMKV